jgi:hypothetical protein
MKHNANGKDDSQESKESPEAAVVQAGKESISQEFSMDSSTIFTTLSFSKERDENVEDIDVVNLIEWTQKLEIGVPKLLNLPYNLTLTGLLTYCSLSLETFDSALCKLKSDVVSARVRGYHADGKGKCAKHWQNLKQSVIQLEGHAAHLVLYDLFLDEFNENRPFGHRYLPFHAYLLSPTLESTIYATGSSILDDGAQTMVALKGAGFGQSSVYLADALPWRTVTEDVAERWMDTTTRYQRRGSRSRGF